VVGDVEGPLRIRPRITEVRMDIGPRLPVVESGTGERGLGEASYRRFDMEWSVRRFAYSVRINEALARMSAK
jgi:hypothetical protein